MLDAVDVLVDDVMSVIGPHGMTLADCIVESPVDIKRIHDECWGTPDVRAWVGGVLYVDSLSEANGPVPTYLDMIRYDARTIVAGLKGNS